MATITLNVTKSALEEGLVVLGLKKYKKMEEKAVPTYYLTGRRAEKLDRLVEEGLKDHRAGRTIKASSLREAMNIYERKKNKRN